MKRLKIALRNSALVLLLATGMADAKVPPDPCYRCYLIYTACLQNIYTNPWYCYQLYQDCAADLNCGN